jgi:hypothetical protein
MKLLISALFVGFVFATFIPGNASAVVCARGVYHAGCIGPRGAVGVHTGYYRRPVVAPYRHGTVVVHRRVY